MIVPSKKSWSRLSLSTKGLILLSIPLCLQLGYSIILVQLQKEAEAEAQRAIDSRSIATHIGHLAGDILQLYIVSQSVDNVQRWRVEGYHGYLSPQYKLLFRKIKAEYETLDKMTVDKPKLNYTVRQSRGPFLPGAEIIEQANMDILAGKMDTVVATSEQKAVQLSALGRDLISKELLLSARNEEDFESKSNTKQAEIRQTILKYSFIVNLASIVFSILLARFLVQTVTSRLRTVAENAVRLAAHQQLQPPLAGSDEIAELDQVFHEVAGIVEDSAHVKQEIYNMVTHDLRAPQTVVQACLEMLSSQSAQEFTPRSKKLIGVAMRNSSRSIGLIKDLLDSQKLEAGMLELNATTVHLEDVFETVNLDIAGWIEEVGIHITFAETDLTLTANQDMLNRILLNLVSNAIKYSPHDSTILVEVTPVAQMAEITVTDQGPGIPRHMLKTIFDRFRQVSSIDPIAQAGSGLGLSICQELVLLHGGKIWVTSELGHGSSFHFTVPLA